MKAIITVCSLLSAGTGFASGNSFFIRDFDVYINGAAVNITWETGIDAQDGMFYIERSSDAVHFEQIRQTEGELLESNVIFLEVDDAPLKGTSHYRIKQVTKEGYTIYSPIRTVKTYEALASELNLVENPCSEEFKDELKAMKDQEILVVLRDEKGNEYFSKITLVNNECTIKAVDGNQEIPKGDYVITSCSKNELYTQQIVIK